MNRLRKSQKSACKTKFQRSPTDPLTRKRLALPFLAGNMPNFEGGGGRTPPTTFKIRVSTPLITVDPKDFIDL